MMKSNILICILCLFFLSCEAEGPLDEKVGPVQKTQEVREDIKKWINAEFSDQQELKRAVEQLAMTPPESCQFKHKVECIEKIVGFDEALEIEIEMMKRILNTTERQKKFDENIQKCHFGQGMNKQVCPHEKSSN